MQGIYKITNQITHKSYIGKTNNYERRMADHKRLAFQLDHKESNKALYQSMRKYGLENFTFELIEELQDYTISGNREKFFIALYNSYNDGYNETPGGDGGSEPGHCQGGANGQAKLTEADVIQIRTLYSQGIGRGECYKLFQNKISESGFGRVWLGQTWTHIMPEVYTEQNKKINMSIGKGSSAKSRRKLTDEEIKHIRQMKKDGWSLSKAYLLYKDKISKSSFDGIWYYRTYKEIV